MIIYLAAFIALMLIRFVVGTSENNPRAYIFALVALFLFSATRFEVGCDWSGYLNQWGIASSIFAPAALERDRDMLWWLFLELIGELGMDYIWVQFMASVVFFYGLHKLAQRQPDPLGFLILTFPVLIINMPMSALRQAIAIGLLCMALVSFMDKREVRYGAFVLAAGLIHSSALVFLLLLPLVRGNLSAKRLILAGILGIPGIALLATGAQADVAVSRYIEGETEALGAAFRVLLVSLTAVAYFLFLRKQWAYLFPTDYKIVTILGLIALPLLLILPVSTVIADRFSYYFIPVQAIIMSRIPFLHLRNQKIWSAAPYAVLTIFFSVWLLSSSHFQKCYVPYQNWIGGKPTLMRFPY